jgi:hypothetical protein
MVGVTDVAWWRRMGSGRQWVRALLFLGLLLYVAGALRTSLPYYTSDKRVEDDVAQHLTPYCAMRAPAQFSDHFLVDYSVAYLPLGYGALCRLAAPWMGPLVFTKVLGLSLLLLTWCVAFLLGRRIAGWVGGIVTCLLVVHCHFIFSVTFAGLFRSFGYPTLLLFIYFWVSGRLRLASVMLVVQALFYPPVFLLSAAGFLVEFLRTPRACVLVPARRRICIWYGVATVVGVALLATMCGKPEGYGAAVTLEQASAMPEWRAPHGRFRTLPLQSRKHEIYESCSRALHWEKDTYARSWRWGRINLKRGDPFMILWLGVLIPLALWRRPFPYWCVALFVGSTALYLLSRHVAFCLGWPDRFLRYCLPLLPLLLFSLAWGGVARWRRRWRVGGHIGLAVLVVGTLLVYPVKAGYTRYLTVDTRKVQPVLTFLRGVDDPMLLAGWPRELLDFIPVCAGKEVLIDYEHMQPLYLGYYAQAMERMTDNLDLLFATDSDTVCRIRDQYGLTHVVLTRALYSLGRRTPRLYAPVNDIASGMRRRVASAEQFLFGRPRPEWCVYEDEHYIVVDLRRIKPVNTKKRENNSEPSEREKTL